MNMDQNGITKLKLRPNDYFPVFKVIEIDDSEEPIKIVLSDGKEEAQFQVSDWIMYPFVAEIVTEGSLLKLLEYKIQDDCIDIIAYRTEDGKEYSLAPSVGSKVFTDINLLTATNSSFRLKARVLSKSPMKQWDKVCSSGRFFTVTLIDKSNSEISGIFYNEISEKFYDRIQELQVYEISKVNIREAERKFNTTRNKNQLVFNENSEIHALEDDPSIKLKNYQFEALSNLENLPSESLVDIIGLVIEVSPLLQLQSESGEAFTKQVFVLMDESRTSVEFVLWNEHIGNVYPKSVLAIKNAQVVSLQYISLKSVHGVSKIEVDPDETATESLKSLLRENKINERYGNPLSMKMTKNNFAIKPVSWVLEQVYLPTFGGELIVHILGRIGYISSESFQDISYESCSLCLRKVEKEDDEFVCFNCNRVSSECKHRYLLFLRIQDSSGYLFATAFENTARNILSVPIEEFKDKSRSEFKLMIELARYKEYLFCIKSKEGDIEEGARMQHMIMSVKEVNPKIINSVLLKSINESIES